MNYFGHAAVAAHFTSSPSIVLGSMLPDFGSMMGLGLTDIALKKQLGVLIESSTEENDRFFFKMLLVGVELHLLTDAKFHPLEFFSEWNQNALRHFRATGIRRGPSRATAHIGVEMAIDAELKYSEKYRQAYLNALTDGVKRSAQLSLLTPKELPFKEFFRHLYQSDVAIHSSSKERYQYRFSRMFQNHQRLAPDEKELELIADFLSTASMQIKLGVPNLMTELLIQIEEDQHFQMLQPLLQLT